MKLYKVSAMSTSFKELLGEFADLIDWLSEDNTGTFIDYGSHVYLLYVDAVLM